MNLILFSEEDRVDARRIRLRGARLRHLREVLGAAPGDLLRVGEIDGRVGRGRLARMDGQAAELTVELSHPPPAKLPVHLALALPRPKMLRRILRMAAEFGVPHLHLINSRRVEKSYWQSPALRPESVTGYFLQGLSQARDTVLPRLSLHRRFKPFVEDELPGMLAGRAGLLAHPGEHPATSAALAADCLLVVGPEGGFLPYEAEKLQAAGCQPLSLGARILRVENAVASLLGACAMAAHASENPRPPRR